MGWSYGTDASGREIGYSVAASCDEPGCGKNIDRGLSYACGGEHGATEHSCDGYFCAAHLVFTIKGLLCQTCAELLKCGQCNGDGVDDEDEECTACNGEGEVAP